MAVIDYQCEYFHNSACRKKNKCFQSKYGGISMCGSWPCRIQLFICTQHHLIITCSCGWINSSQFLSAAVPTIINPLVFTQGFPSSTLTCTSTTSIATTVPFMRDGNAINRIVRDGDSATVNGVTYHLSQTLTNRTQSTYDNVLTITGALSSLAGSNFTCRVENALGMSTISDSFQMLGKTLGLCMYTY